jgi:hypothetical protein
MNGGRRALRRTFRRDRVWRTMFREIFDPEGRIRLNIRAAVASQRA